jgi:acetyl esterase/lipase
MAFDWLCRSGAAPERIALVGDSAGGNLVVSLAVRLRDLGRPAPACVVAFSPWTDLAGRGDSVRANDGRCAMFRTENIRDFAQVALGDRMAADDPRVSPLYADLSTLPPMLLQVGSTELLLDDARGLHDRIVAGGGSSTLEVFDEVPHGWQMLAPFVPEANRSLDRAAAFIDSALSPGLR